MDWIREKAVISPSLRLFHFGRIWLTDRHHHTQVPFPTFNLRDALYELSHTKHTPHREAPFSHLHGNKGIQCEEQHTKKRNADWTVAPWINFTQCACVLCRPRNTRQHSVATALKGVHSHVLIGHNWVDFLFSVCTTLQWGEWGYMLELC